MKKIGAIPKNSPMVVRPNASPGLFFKTETNNASVIDIVILNITIPSRDTIII
jgi:hypothetical protein